MKPIVTARTNNAVIHLPGNPPSNRPLRIEAAIPSLKLLPGLTHVCESLIVIEPGHFLIRQYGEQRLGIREM